jgi:hypothetical protein
VSVIPFPRRKWPAWHKGLPEALVLAALLALFSALILTYNR